jgi:hypothetical protein
MVKKPKLPDFQGVLVSFVALKQCENSTLRMRLQHVHSSCAPLQRRDDNVLPLWPSAFVRGAITPLRHPPRVREFETAISGEFEWPSGVKVVY